MTEVEACGPTIIEQAARALVDTGEGVNEHTVAVSEKEFGDLREALGMPRYDPEDEDEVGIGMEICYAGSTGHPSKPGYREIVVALRATGGDVLDPAVVAQVIDLRLAVRHPVLQMDPAPLRAWAGDRVWPAETLEFVVNGQPTEVSTRGADTLGELVARARQQTGYDRYGPEWETRDATGALLADDTPTSVLVGQLFVNLRAGVGA